MPNKISRLTISQNYNIHVKKTKREAPKLDATPEVREKWSDKRTLRQNYKALGLAYSTTDTVDGLQEEMFINEVQDLVERDEDGEVLVREDVEGKEELKKMLHVCWVVWCGDSVGT